MSVDLKNWALGQLRMIGNNFANEELKYTKKKHWRIIYEQSLLTNQVNIIAYIYVQVKVISLKWLFVKYSF